ncbi:hypothetical protein [Actinoplanes sp. HUAS TT8]|uniref:hypothetical protein n=1 Tax=Actinoplanes sp. HUAS TT8 TaxID=3447453 RepID=UPI003F5214D8
MNDDVEGIDDLIDAARWWARYRDTDVTYWLRETLKEIPRDVLERFASDHESGRIALGVLEQRGDLRSERRDPAE